MLEAEKYAVRSHKCRRTGLHWQCRHVSGVIDYYELAKKYYLHKKVIGNDQLTNLVWILRPLPGCQTNLRKLVGFTRNTGVRFLPKFAIFTRFILNLRPNFEKFTRIKKLLLRGFSGVLGSSTNHVITCTVTDL